MFVVACKNPQVTQIWMIDQNVIKTLKPFRGSCRWSSSACESPDAGGVRKGLDTRGCPWWV